MDSAFPPRAGDNFRLWFPVAAWLLGLSFACGALYSQVRSCADAIGIVERRVTEHDTRMNESNMHQVSTEARMTQLEAYHRDNEAELKGLAEKLEKLNRNMVAVCQATHGAQCER